ncbi:MAG: alanine--glyoxylate aminotransferase family protein [Deltaproteobacteria bacterium]|nr:alanine--glyoxylate aminotransferase family protein [Deltaproteobacteria bacterium]
MKRRKKKLFTPGPCEIPLSVFKAMGHIEHHRTPQFKQVMQDIQNGLQYIFQTNQLVITLCSSGTGAMEAAIVNVFKKNDKVLVVNGGKFGERWGKIAKNYGLQVLELSVEWGKAVQVEDIAQVLKKNQDVCGIFIQALETSTGVVHPIEELAFYLKKLSRKPLLVVDAISGLLTSALPMDNWGLDVVVAGSQKGLCLPPGLAFIALSSRAWEMAHVSDVPKYYFNLLVERKCLEQHTTAFSTPVTLMLGLQESLRLLQRQTLPRILDQYNKMQQLVLKTLTSWGLEIFSFFSSTAVIGVRAPNHIPSQLIIKKLKDDFDITIANGQEELKDKIFRLSYMGAIQMQDVRFLLSCLKKVLQDLKVPIGKKRAFQIKNREARL